VRVALSAKPRETIRFKVCLNFKTNHVVLRQFRDSEVDPRLIHRPTLGKVVAIRQVSGLHHRYERLAA
jgi:hypothetical protein